MQVLEKFLKPADPRELVRKWQLELKSEERRLDRQIRDIQFEVKKVTKSIKDAAKRNDLASCKILAKEVVASKKAITRFWTTKAQLSGLGMMLAEQLAFVRVSGALAKSSEVMKAVNDTMKLPEMQKTMMELSREMCKAGLIEEMVNDAIDDTIDEEDTEELTETEMARVLEEIGLETAALLPGAKRSEQQQAAQEKEDEAAHDEELASLNERLQAVRS